MKDINLLIFLNLKFRIQNSKILISILKYLYILIFLYSPIFGASLKTGEYLKYEVSLIGLTVGYSTMEIPEKIQCEKSECLVFETKAWGSAWINTFFPVDDHIVSHWDPDNQLPVYSYKKIREGFYKRTSIVWYNLNSKTAHWTKKEYSGNTDKAGEERKGIKWKDGEGEVSKLPDNFQDILSAIYFQRIHPGEAEIGKSFSIFLFDDNKLSEMKMNILRKEEISLKINGKLEKFSTIVVQPFIKTTGIFRSKGNIYIWISDDTNRYPIQITADLPIAGHVTVKLSEIHYPN